MELQVAASESSVMQRDDDSYPSDTIAEQAGNQHALLKTPKYMDKKEEDISGDASEEVYISPETTSEKIKACCPDTGIKLTAPSISSVDDTQNTHDIPSAEKGDMESPLPKEQDAEITQTSLQECSSIKMGDSIDNDSEVTEVEHEKKEINAEATQISSMLIKPDIQETAEYGSDEMENENFSKQMLPPITEKSIEQPFYEESHEAGDNSAQLKAEDDSSMKTAEIQVQNTHIPLTADQEDVSPQDLSYEKESDNEGMSPEDAQQISEEISESRNVSCADVDVESTSEPQQSYQEVLQPSQIIFEGANDSKENANDNSNDKEVTTSTEEMLVDSSSAIEDRSKKIESEIYESKTIRSEDGAYVDQLAEHATIEATEKSSQVGLAAVTGSANIEENDEHQTCQTEVEENETISEMIKQNQIFQESDLQEKNVISTESISYDHANMTNAALEGDNDERVELKAEEIGYSFEEENVETATREPYSSDQISSTDEISVPFSEEGDSAISTDSDKVSNLNDNGNMESIDTEAKLEMMQEVENKREIVVETASDDITEEINDESYMVSENQVDNLTNKATEEPDLIANSRQNIPLSAEDQINKLTDVREKAYESVGENNAIEEENDSIRSPDKDAEKNSESNYEEIQNDSKPGQSCRNEPDIVKHLEIVNPEIEETKLDQGEQNQENSIHNDAIGSDGDAQSTFTNIEPTSLENHENLEDATNSAAAENGDDQNENQSLNVTYVQTGTEAEDTINKTDDSEKDVDLQYKEETQSTREATVESFQSAITDEMEDDKNLENINADPSQEHDEINNKNSNYDEESNEYKEQEPNEANEFHSKDESKTEEAKTQVYEEGSSSNKEGIRTVEVSQSQDECSEVYEDSIHVTEVEESTDKQHEEQEDRSPYGEHDDGVLADQVKAMNAGMDSQNENELNTSNSAGVHVQEDQTERESCKYDEMDESDTRKDKDIISQEFEQDNLVNAITSQESSPPIEQLEHNLGAAMDDPTVSQPSEIVDDETISVEASQAIRPEAEQYIKTNEDPKQEKDISADTIIQGDSAGELQHITNSAIGYENSTTFAEADKHGSADHLKIVDCKDDEHAENLQESESENQGLATKEVDTAIEANKDDNFDQEFQEMNANPMELSKNTGTEPDNIEVQNDGRVDEEGVCDDTAKTVPVTDPKIEGDLSTEIPYQSGKPDQEIYADNPVISRDEGTGESSEAMQVVDFHEEISTDCRVSPKEVIPIDAGTDIQQENDSSAASMDCKQDQEDQRGLEFFKNSKMDESHPEKDIELINQGFEQDSISSEMPCQKTSAVIEALRQDIGTAMDDHTQNEPSEIANDSKKADFETEQHNQTDEELEHENEISAEESMDVENREFITESAELGEVNITENEAINSRTVDLGSNTVEDLSGSENTNLEISEKMINLDEDPKVNTEVMPQDKSIENCELLPESAELAEDNNTENEAISSRATDLGSNTVEDLGGNENTNSEVSQKVTSLDEDPKVDTEVVPQDVDVGDHEIIPESTETNTENEAINSKADELGSNTIEDSNGNENTNLEISQKEINLNEDPIVETEGVLQDMDVENHKFIPESTELIEENNTENEAINSKAEESGPNTAGELGGNENTNSEISQKVTSLDEDPKVNTEAVPQDMSVENRELVPGSGELAEENDTDNETINRRAEDLGSNTAEDSGNENTNLEISLKKINTEDVRQDMDVVNRELIPESTKQREENNGEEAINSRTADLSSNTVEDLSGGENTNLEISEKVINLDEDPKVNTEVTPQDVSFENRELIPESVESVELTDENNTENEAVNSREEDLGSNTVEDIGNENTNLEVSQKEISLNENPTVDTDVVLQGMDVESYELIPESTELREENSTENETVKCRTVGLGSKTVEDLSGNENTNSEISQKLTNLDEEKNAEVMPQVMDVENLEFIPESTELIEEINTENEAINSKADESGPNTAGDLGGNENTNSEISQKDPIVKVNMLQTMEKIQDDEEPENTEREITQDGSDSQHTLAEERTIDQEKLIDIVDTPQLENEEKTCMYDEEIQEVKETHEQCKFNEMNESVSFKNKEIESQGFEDDCTSKRIQNEQTRMHSEASGQNVGAEIPSNQDNEESRINASKVINRQEVAEHDEHRNEALLDKINEQEVICPNASSSGNGMDTSAEQTTEPPLEISQSNNADQGLELGVYEQSIEGNEEEDELDSNKPKFNAEMVVNPIEESQCKDDRDKEINGQPTQTQSGNGISTAVEPSQYILECEPNEAKQDGNVSNVTKSYIDGHRIDEISPDETVQTQENFLEPSSPSEATSTTRGKEDCSVTLQDLNKEKEEDPAPEKATQRELQVSSGFELCGDLPYKPAVEDVSITEEYLAPEAQGANDPLDNEKMEPRSSTNSYSHEINSDADQFQHNSQQTVRVSGADEPSIRPVSENYGHTSEEVTENQEETKSPKQLIESNNEEQTMEDIIDGSGCHAVKSEMTVEESKSRENYGPHGISAYDSTEEKQVAAGSIEIVERSSEPVPFKESKKDEDKITEEKEETSADAESHEPEFYKTENHADRDEKTLSSTECNTKSDECSITISKDSKEISEEPQILVTSSSLEGEAVGENFQQSTSEERTENEVSMDASELLHQMNVPKPDNMDDEKEKQQESAKGLESQQGNDRILFTEMQSEGKFPNESDVHMDYQEEEKISAAEIIASHIFQEIESEEKLKQPSSEHQNQRPETSTLVTDANDTTFEKEVVCAPEEREIEHPSLEVEPDRDLEQKQYLNEELRTMDNSVRTDPNELSSEFQGVEPSAEVESDTEDTTTKSCDETKKPLIADEHSANTTFSVSQVSGINSTPPTETIATEEKVSEEQPMKKVSNHDSDIPQTMQIDKEEQLQEITDEKYNETEEKPMLPSIIDEKKAGEWVVVSQNVQDDEERAADEPKTEKEKEDTENDHGEEDSELIPMISEASRDIELKTQNKKSLHILSGMGSKMKNSISKVKKAMACASPQFSPDDVIIKLNKSKKS